MRAAGVLSSALVVVAAAALLAQSPTPQAPVPGQPTPGQPSAPPSRTPPRAQRPGDPPPKGTSVIKGRVIASDTGAPVRRAQVRAVAPETQSISTTSTDSEGRFEIKELPAGRYSVSAAKGGYVTMQYGQRRPNEPGTPIQLSDNQTAENVAFALLRGGAITGHITDDAGEAVTGAQVTASRYAFVGGARRLVPAGAEGGFDRTDDLGNYRLYGLPPGEFYVSAVMRNGTIMMAGNSTNTEDEPFATTYYPGTPNISEALRVPVKVSQETPVNFSLVAARMSTVSGRVINSRGEPMARAMVMLTPADTTFLSFAASPPNMLGADGGFTLRGVAPGRYLLTVRPMSGAPTATTEFGVMPLTVGNDDIDNVLVVTGVGAIARGTIRSDDGTPLPFRPDTLQVFAATLEPSAIPMASPMPKVNDDFTFEVTGLFDRRLLRVSTGAAAGWYLKQVLRNGDDVTDTGIEFTPGREVEGLEVVLTQRATDLSGIVTDDRGNPVLDATVVIFPASRDRWRFQSRFMRTARPDTNGRYSFKGLPPSDEYRLIAVQNLESGQGADPEFLERAVEEATRLTLAEGETKALDVKLSTLVP